MLTWDLQETRDFVRKHFGHQQFELARQSLSSTIDRRVRVRKVTRALPEKMCAYHITYCFEGALNTNRTCDLPLRRGSLYPLSYRGVAAF